MLKGYPYIWVSPTEMHAVHRWAVTAPPGAEVDHIDCNKLNNLRSNLRLCTKSQNQHNRAKQKNNTSGYKGVHLQKRTGKYRAQIKLHGKRKILGLFSTPELAYAAYCSAAVQLHGDFARL